jgi:hypothetical protein
VADQNRRNNQKNRMQIRNDNLRRHYGISHADYESMAASQGGVCAICGTQEPGQKKRYFCVDHDHETGKVRQLLCNDCNVGLARLGEDPERLRRAAEYLERHRAAAIRPVGEG